MMRDESRCAEKPQHTHNRNCDKCGGGGGGQVNECEMRYG